MSGGASPSLPPSLHPSRSLPALSSSTTTAPTPSTGGCEVRGGDRAGDPAGTPGEPLWGCQPLWQLWKGGWGENGGPCSLGGRVVTALGSLWFTSRFFSPRRVQGKTLLLQMEVPGMCPRVPRLFRAKLCPLPLFPSIPELRAPCQDCGAQSRVPPVLPGPRSLAEQNCPPGEEQSRGVVLVLSCTRCCLGHCWLCRVSRLFQSHHGDSGWIREQFPALLVPSQPWDQPWHPNPVKCSRRPCPHSPVSPRCPCPCADLPLRAAAGEDQGEEPAAQRCGQDSVGGERSLFALGTIWGHRGT